MKQKEIKMYKCCLPDGSYVVMFSSNEKRFFRFNDLSGSGFDELNYTKIEYLEQPDTLQEVVEDRKSVGGG